ncbi:insulinase family protein [Paraglaciecola arctica]|uniref:insulinase family protein n=1 Tax=Paraglaciecola arctica TaxID=1128911 RepID=UPI001C075061|nr:insulinase family protein [Paraglaciecola arctica]MBU3002025.1 insulinase family protein [Paraglaciecola arctica]
MLKSAYDNRQFNHIKLANGLRVLLVQDPNSIKSACSITFNVGHFDDDKDCHGISHLLEHMLFLGNSNYPRPNEFNDFVSTHGGCVNALTGTEYTSFFYDIACEYEQQALIHLRAMFDKPLFNPALIEKEINAIDSEFLLKQKDDLRRLYQVHKETCNPNHPFSQFSVGNKETFAPFTVEQLQQKLQRLFHGFYQPQNACLCLVSQHDLSITEGYVRKLFSDWTGNCKLTRDAQPALYLASNLGVQINILPLQKAKRMILTFALPEQRTHYRSKPLSVLSHILGDEGKGGLLHFYKAQDWATNLSAGGGIEGSTFKDFNINLQLTDKGITHSDAVITALFSYIQLIKDCGIEPWRIKETATLNQLMWDFPDQAKAIDEASHFSQAMFEYPIHHLVAGEHILDKPDVGIVLQMLEFFCPQNMRIKAVNPSVNVTQTAKWYQTPYSVESISTQRIKHFMSGQWRSSFMLPKANQFLPTCKTSQPVNKNYVLPKKIVCENGLDFWYGQDHKFKQPKGDCFLTFDCPAINEGVQLTTAKRLWVALLNEKLNQKYYQANLAGMHFHFYPHQGGFSLQTNGFSANQLEFCTNLLTKIVIHEDFSSSFAQVKAKQYQGLSNTVLNKPINRLFTTLAVIMQQQNQASSDMIQVMENLTLDDVESTKTKLLNQFHLEGMMYGDWSQEEANQVSVDIKAFRKRHKHSQKIHRGVADIRHNKAISFEVECQHKDPAVVIYFQAPDASLKNVALTILAEQLLATPFFNQLRTEQQLGYLVGSGYIPYNQHPGIGFYIQSPQHSAEYLIDAIHLFLQQITENIDQFNHIWDPLKKGVIKQLMEKDTNLSMKSQRLWMAIGNQDTAFSYNIRMTKTIEEIDFSALKSYLIALVSRQGFGEIILYSASSTQTLLRFPTEVITNIQHFKSNTQYI